MSQCVIWVSDDDPVATLFYSTNSRNFSTQKNITREQKESHTPVTESRKEKRLCYNI